MLNLTKKKKFALLGIAAVLVIWLFPSSPDKPKTFIERGGKYDFIKDSVCHISYEKESHSDKEYSVFGNITSLYIPENIKVNDSEELLLSDILDYANVNLDNKDEILKSRAWDDYRRLYSRHSELEWAEFERDKTPPKQFISFVEFSKEYMNKLYSLDKFSLSNIIFEGRYDSNGEKLVLSRGWSSSLNDLVGKLIYGNIDYNKENIIIDLPLKEMKDITSEPSRTLFAIDLLFEKSNDSNSNEVSQELKTKYTIKAISPKMTAFLDIIKDKKLDPDCGQYRVEHGAYDKSYEPLSDGELGTLEVKSAKVCGRDSSEDCNELEVSDSF